MTLGRHTTNAVLWNFAQQLSQRGIGILVTLLLARLLVPEDFGLMAMMAIFISVASTLMDGGFQQALIQKKNVSQADLSTAFVANVALGATAYLLLFLLAPFVAEFYAQPDLVRLIRFTGLAISFSSLQVVQTAVLSRTLNFKAQLTITLPSTFISGLAAIGFAYSGYGVWALAFQVVLASLLGSLFVWRIRVWRPTFEFSWPALKAMLDFAAKLFFSSLLDTVFKNLYIIVIAKFFAATVAGHYFFANKIKDLVLRQLVGAIQTVTYPAFASLQDENVSLKAGYRKVMQITTFLLFPAMLFLAALSGRAFDAFLSDEWLPSVKILQLMCLIDLAYPLHAINLNILKVKGRSDLFFYLEIGKKISLVFVLILSFQYGITGILIGQLFHSLISYVPNSYFSAKLINYPIKEQLWDVLPGFALSAAVAAIIYLVAHYSSLPSWIILLTTIPTGGALYLICARIFKLHAFAIAEKLLRERFGAKSKPYSPSASSY